jgi:hypothetical protein
LFRYLVYFLLLSIFFNPGVGYGCLDSVTAATSHALHVLIIIIFHAVIYDVQCDTDGGSALGHPTDILQVGEQDWDVNHGCQDPLCTHYSVTSRRKQEVQGRINLVGSGKLLLVLASRVILGSELLSHDSVSRETPGRTNHLLSFHYIFSIWHDKYRIENTASNNSAIVVACILVAVGTCLPSRCLTTIKGDTQTHR